MKEQATPRPWRRGRGSQSEFIESQIHGQPLQRVASIYYGTLSPEERNANAALIVTAVNAHDDLVRACELALEELEHIWHREPGPESHAPREMVKTALRSALAKAEA